MVVMFLFMTVGFVLRKKKILPEGTDKALSKLEIFVFLPAMNFYNQLNNCTPKSFCENYPLVITGGVLVIISILLAYPLSRLFVKKREGEERSISYKRNIYKYAIALANFGFIGNFLVLEIWGEVGLFRYSLFTFCLSIACYAWGLAILAPSDKGDSGKLRAAVGRICTPALIALVLGALLGLFGVGRYMPDFIGRLFLGASDCMGPCAMLLAGFVIGGYSFKSIVSDKKIYLVSILRLIVIPGVILCALKLLELDFAVPYALVAFAAPLGLNTVVFPAAYGEDTKTGASMALISTVISLATIPLMYYIFFILWV